MAEANTLVVVDGVTVALPEIGALLEKEFATDASQGVLSGAPWQSTVKQSFERVLCFVAQPLTMAQLTPLRNACALGATVVFHSAPENVHPLATTELIGCS